VSAPRFRPRPGGQSGMTLIETLVALAVISLVMITVLASLTRLQEQRIQAASIERATALALIMMAENEIRGADRITPGSGNFPEPDKDMAWTLELDGAKDPDLSRLTVRVTWGTGEKHQVSLTRLVTR